MNPAGQTRQSRPVGTADLQWWSEFLSSPSSWSLTLSPTSKVVLTDASDNGWGGGALIRDIMQPDSHGRRCSPNANSFHTHPVTNAKEVLAVIVALSSARMTATYTCTVFSTQDESLIFHVVTLSSYTAMYVL